MSKVLPNCCVLLYLCQLCPIYPSPLKFKGFVSVTQAASELSCKGADQRHAEKLLGHPGSTLTAQLLLPHKSI